MVKNLSANAGDIRDLGLILGSGRHPGVCLHLPVGAGQSSILAWTIPWTKEAGGLTVHAVTKRWIRQQINNNDNSTYKLNKQGDYIQLCHTLFPVLVIKFKKKTILMDFSRKSIEEKN